MDVGYVTMLAYWQAPLGVKDGVTNPGPLA